MGQPSSKEDNIIYRIFFIEYFVGLLNILDSEFIRRKPARRPHGEVVGAAVVDSELPGEVIQGVQAAAGVKL